MDGLSTFLQREPYPRLQRRDISIRGYNAKRLRKIRRYRRRRWMCEGSTSDSLSFSDKVKAKLRRKLKRRLKKQWEKEILEELQADFKRQLRVDIDCDLRLEKDSNATLQRAWVTGDEESSSQRKVRSDAKDSQAEGSSPMALANDQTEAHAASKCGACATDSSKSHGTNGASTVSDTSCNVRSGYRVTSWVKTQLAELNGR